MKNTIRNNEIWYFHIITWVPFNVLGVVSEKAISVTGIILELDNSLLALANVTPGPKYNFNAYQKFMMRLNKAQK